MKDALIRFPLWLMKRRPHNMAVRNEVRQKTSTPPYSAPEQAPTNKTGG
jgi:hypothetical protein